MKKICRNLRAKTRAFPSLSKTKQLECERSLDRDDEKQSVQRTNCRHSK